MYTNLYFHRAKENEVHADIHPAKRHQAHPVSPGSNSRISPNGPVGFTHNNNFGPIRLEDISVSREMREREAARERELRERSERERFERERERHFSNSSFNSYSHRDTPFDHIDRQEDDWKHIESVSDFNLMSSTFFCLKYCYYMYFAFSSTVNKVFRKMLFLSKLMKPSCNPQPRITY